VSPLTRGSGWICREAVEHLPGETRADRLRTSIRQRLMSHYCLSFRHQETGLSSIAEMIVDFFENLSDWGKRVYRDNRRRLHPI
jgi:hypothetical protein